MPKDEYNQSFRDTDFDKSLYIDDEDIIYKPYDGEDALAVIIPIEYDEELQSDFSKADKQPVSEVKAAEEKRDIISAIPSLISSIPSFIEHTGEITVNIFKKFILWLDLCPGVCYNRSNNTKWGDPYGSSLSARTTAVGGRAIGSRLHQSATMHHQSALDLGHCRGCIRFQCNSLPCHSKMRLCFSLRNEIPFDRGYAKRSAELRNESDPFKILHRVP